MKLWRINLKPRSREPRQDVTEFGVEREAVGIGRKVHPVPASKECYWKRGKERYPGRQEKLVRSRQGAAVPNGPRSPGLDREPQGRYYLAKIDGDWRPDNNSEHIEADIVNLRPCIWLLVGTMDNVPGTGIKAFRPAATIQKVRDPLGSTKFSISFGEEVARRAPRSKVCGPARHCP